jgi:hypothetical protein
MLALAGSHGIANYPKDTQLEHASLRSCWRKACSALYFRNRSDVQAGDFHELPEPRFAAGLIRGVVEICEVSDQFHYPIDFVVKHPVAPEINPVPTLGWVRTALPFGAVQRSTSGLGCSALNSSSFVG